MQHAFGGIAVVVSMVLTVPLLAQEVDYSPQHELLPGTELIMVYVGSSTCGPCLLPENKTAVRALKNVLFRQATSQGKLFSTMGVALDWDVETGYRFLTDVAPWDEVVIGKSWTNMAASRLLWRVDSVSPAIPHVMVLEREVIPKQSEIEISEYRLVGQYHGLSSWLEEGAPLER